MVLMVSCVPGKVLVVTDPYWDDFSSAGRPLGKVRDYSYFITKGLFPVFRSYGGFPEDFQSWFLDEVDGGGYDRIVATYLYFFELNPLVESGTAAVLLGGSPQLRYEKFHQISISRTAALKAAGRVMREAWEDDGAVPVVIFWENPRRSEQEWDAFLDGWGRDLRDVAEENRLRLNENIRDTDGRLIQFYESFDFSGGKWTLLVSAEPVLDDVMKTWPEGDNIRVILSAPPHKLLPENCEYLLVPDFGGMMNAAASAVSKGEPGGVSEVGVRLIRK